MAEERIEIKYNKEDCPCIKCESVMSCEERNCEKLTEWECQEKYIVYNRQEAIICIAEALNKTNGSIVSKAKAKIAITEWEKIRNKTN